MENKYNATFLDAELRAQGLEIQGCSSQGRIDWKKSPSAEQRQKAEAVLKAHVANALSPREAKLKALQEKRRQGLKLTPEEIQSAIDLFLGI